MPIQENIAPSCPVALSDASCFPEIAGAAALYFDPSSVASIAAALERGLACRASRRRRSREGRERLKRFSWAATAERTAAVYERCVAEGGRGDGRKCGSSVDRRARRDVPSPATTICAGHAAGGTSA